MALEDYKALFGNQFDDIVDAILTGGLTPQVEAMMIGTIDQMVFNVNVFAENINKTVVNMGKAGVSSNVIKSTLNTDMKNGGKIFGQLRNETKETLVGGVNKASGIGQYETYLDNGVTEKDMFAWVTASGHRICQDCAARGGAEKTFKEWESEGLPGSGATVCGGYCYCVVDPVGKMDKEVKINTKAVKEKGASIRKPAGWSPTMTTAQAVKWNATSKFQGTFYHGTTSEGVAGIRKSGFDMSMKTTGQISGKGAYGTRNAQEIATAFAGEGGEVMSIMYNVKNPLYVNDEFMRAIISGRLPYQGGKRSVLLQNGGRMGTFGEVAPGYEKYMGKAKRKWLKRVHENALKNPNLNPIDDFEQFLRSEFDTKFDVAKFKPTEAHNTAFDLGDKWYQYLDDLYVAGDTRAVTMMDRSLELSRHGWRFDEEFGNLFTEFLQKQGYDGLVVEQVQFVRPGLFDDYFIAFNKESVTAIVD